MGTAAKELTIGQLHDKMLNKIGLTPEGDFDKLCVDGLTQETLPSATQEALQSADGHDHPRYEFVHNLNRYLLVTTDSYPRTGNATADWDAERETFYRDRLSTLPSQQREPLLAVLKHGFGTPGSMARAIAEHDPTLQSIGGSSKLPGIGFGDDTLPESVTLVTQELRKAIEHPSTSFIETCKLADLVGRLCSEDIHGFHRGRNPRLTLEDYCFVYVLAGKQISTGEFSQGTACVTAVQDLMRDSYWDLTSQAFWHRLTPENKKSWAQDFLTLRIRNNPDYPDDASGETLDELLALASYATEAPDDVVQSIYAHSLAGAQKRRKIIQDVCGHFQQTSHHQRNSLGDKRSSTRKAVATWLSRCPNPDLSPDLLAAYQSEKVQGVRSALVTALVASGLDLDGVLSLDDITQVAGKVKWPTKKSEWIDLEELPKLIWNESAGNQPIVSQDVVCWILTECIAHKTPKLPGMCSFALNCMKAETVNAFVDHIVQAWVAQDTKPGSAEKIRERAVTHVDNWQWDLEQGTPEYEAAIDRAMIKKADEPGGSAITSIGLLALGSARGQCETIAALEWFVAKHYKRTAQCRFILEVLSQRDEARAHNVLIDVATSYQSPAVRDTTRVLVNDVAARYDISPGELADRVLPDLGFDLSGTWQSATAGTKTTVSLRQDLGLRVQVGDGDPMANKDFPDEIQNLSKDLTRLRHQLVLRFRNALATGFEWTAESWVTNIAQHPLTRVAASQTVWRETGGAEDAHTFRLVDDGSYLTADGDERPAPVGLVSMAHHTNVSDTEVSLWNDHYLDFALTPFVPQFGRKLDPTLSQKSLTVNVFKGYEVNSKSIRHQFTALGYETYAPDGEAQYFTRDIPGYPWLAKVHVFGVLMGGGSDRAFLTDIDFVPPAAEGTASATAKDWSLADVPAAFLAEVVADVQDLARQGKGYDPAWEEHGY